MTAGVLTVDQRWLLRMVGGWAMRDCLVGPDGVNHLMASMYGGGGGRVEGGPDWMAGGFQCGGGRIMSPTFGEPVVTVTKAQLNRYAKSLPDDIKTELVLCQTADRANNWEQYTHCHCRSEPCCYAYMPDRIHPTAAEVEAVRAEDWRIREWVKRLVDRALGFGDDAVEPTGQLDLFGATA